MDVHQHDVPGSGLPGLHRGPAVADDGRFDAGLLQHGAQHQLVDGVVLGRQHPQGSGVDRLGLDVGLRLGRGRGGFVRQPRQRQCRGETGSATDLALNRDLALHQLHEIAADGQTQAGAAETACRGGVGLFELFEQLVEAVGGNADARILDPDRQARRGRADGDAHLALLGELQGVGDQVVEDLAHPHPVAEIDPAGRRLDGEVKAQVLLFGDPAEGAVGAAGQFGRVEGRGLQLQLPGFDLRQVEHVVENGQQGLAGLLDDLHPLALNRRQGLGGHDLGHAEDAVERGADLVAHGGQEGALGDVGGLGVVPGAHHGLLGQLALGDVLHGAQHPQRPPGFVLVQVGRALDPDLLTVRPVDPVLGAEGLAVLRMATPKLGHHVPVARIDRGLDVPVEIIIGLRPHEEGVFGAGLEQLAPGVIHLEYVQIGQAERHVEALFVARDLLQGADEFGDVVGGDDDPAHLAFGVQPGGDLGLQVGDRTVAAGNLDPLAGEPLALEALIQGALPAPVEAAGDAEDALAAYVGVLDPQAARPKAAVGDDVQVAVGHHDRQGQGADQGAQGLPGRVPFPLRLLGGPRGAAAVPVVGDGVGQVAQADRHLGVVGPRFRPGDPDHADGGPVRDADRRAGVEPQVGRLGDPTVVAEPRLLPGVLDPEQVAGRQDRLGGGVVLQGDRAPAETLPGVAVVDKGDAGGPGVEQVGGDADRPADHRHRKVHAERREVVGRIRGTVFHLAVTPLERHSFFQLWVCRVNKRITLGHRRGVPVDAASGALRWSGRALPDQPIGTP